MQHALRVEEYDADDADAVEASRPVLNAGTCRRRAVPAAANAVPAHDGRALRAGTTARCGTCSAAVDGVPVAIADVELGEWDNRDLAWFYLVVHPAHRGVGTAPQLLAHVLDLARERRPHQVRRRLVGVARSEPFARRHGFVAGLAGDLPGRAAAGAAARSRRRGVRRRGGPHARDYELVRIEGHAPEELLPARLGAHGRHQRRPARRPRHRGRGVPGRADPRLRERDGRRPGTGSTGSWPGTGRPASRRGTPSWPSTPRRRRWPTSTTPPVVREHRGHRLGLLLKAEMMRWLAEVEPQVAIDRHVQRGVERPHDRGQRAARLPGGGPDPAAPAALGDGDVRGGGPVRPAGSTYDAGSRPPRSRPGRAAPRTSAGRR